MMDETMGPSNTMNCTGEKDFVEVMFARSMPEARDFVSYLLEQEIPARLENTGGAVPACGVAILVPSDRMIEAAELLAARVDAEDDSDEVEGEEEFDDLDDDYDDEDDEDDEFDDDDDEFGDDDEEEEFEEEDDI